jgi:Tfp pilus assembly protein PilE
MKSSRGFTIVEIIVICVVIGILASIAVVGYNSLQQSSRDSLRAQKMKEWSSTLTTFKTKYGLYPLPTDPTPSSTGTYYCLYEVNPATACDTPSFINAEGSTVLLTAAKKAGQLPASNFPLTNTTGGPVLYIAYESTTGAMTEVALVAPFEQNKCDDYDLATNQYTIDNPTSKPYFCELSL